MAALYALQKAGFACFDSKECRWRATQTAFDAMQLEEYFLDADQLQKALDPQFYFLLRAESAWCSCEHRLVKLILSELDQDAVRRLWRYVGTAIGGIAVDELRLVGLGARGSLIFDVVNVAPGEFDESIYFSLCGEAQADDVPAVNIAPRSLNGKEKSAEQLILWPY